MNRSSRQQPCPCCGRNVNGNCRWSDDLILCYQGDRFAPPSDLQIGDTITIDGESWALLRRDGGFSGMAAVFRPHKPRQPGEKDYSRRPRPNRKLLSLQAKRSQWADAIEQFHDAFQLAWNIPDFYEATPDQLKAAEEVINDAQARGAALRPHLRQIWREHPDLDQLHRLRIDSQLKSLAYIAEHFRYFQINELATSRPAAVHELAAERF